MMPSSPRSSAGSAHTWPVRDLANMAASATNICPGALLRVPAPGPMQSRSARAPRCGPTTTCSPRTGATITPFVPLPPSPPSGVPVAASEQRPASARGGLRDGVRHRSGAGGQRERDASELGGDTVPAACPAKHCVIAVAYLDRRHWPDCPRALRVGPGVRRAPGRPPPTPSDARQHATPPAPPSSGRPARRAVARIHWRPGRATRSGHRPEMPARRSSRGTGTSAARPRPGCRAARGGRRA